jgi:uncharacterized membrane protein
MNIEARNKTGQFILKGIVGYFGPVIALCRLRKKHSWNYVRQLRVVYRYVFRR